jgi:hypothetical protein
MLLYVYFHVSFSLSPTESKVQCSKRLYILLVTLIEMERRAQICQIEKWSYEIQERADAKWKRQTPICEW